MIQALQYLGGREAFERAELNCPAKMPKMTPSEKSDFLRCLDRIPYYIKWKDKKSGAQVKIDRASYY